MVIMKILLIYKYNRFRSKFAGGSFNKSNHKNDVLPRAKKS